MQKRKRWSTASGEPWRRNSKSSERLALKRFVTSASQHRQARIFGKAGVSGKPLTQVEDRSTVGFDVPHKTTAGAKPDIPGRSLSRLFLLHGNHCQLITALQIQAFREGWRHCSGILKLHASP